MKTWSYKGHFVFFERVQHSGAVIASGDIERRTFYGYTLAQIKTELKAAINAA